MLSTFAIYFVRRTLKIVLDALAAMEAVETEQNNEAIELALDEEMDFNQQGPLSTMSHVCDIAYVT